MKRLYGIRGAITAENNKESITEKTVEMCSLIFNENKLLPEDFVSMHFTLTKEKNCSHLNGTLKFSKYFHVSYFTLSSE